MLCSRASGLPVLYNEQGKRPLEIGPAGEFGAASLRLLHKVRQSTQGQGLTQS